MTHKWNAGGDFFLMMCLIVFMPVLFCIREGICEYVSVCAQVHDQSIAYKYVGGRSGCWVSWVELSPRIIWVLLGCCNQKSDPHDCTASTFLCWDIPLVLAWPFVVKVLYMVYNTLKGKKLSGPFSFFQFDSLKLGMVGIFQPLSRWGILDATMEGQTPVSLG